MRIPPNCFKILHRWGVDLTYMKKTYSNGNRFLRYDTGAVIADMPHGIPEWEFGGSYLMVHRADYHAVLLQKALDLGVDIRPNSRVVKYDWEIPAIEIQSGERVAGDVLVIADGSSWFRTKRKVGTNTRGCSGVQSKAREQILGRKLPPIDTGDTSYRILIPGEVLLADPELRDLISQPWVSSWCGPDAHVIGYPVRGGEVYNVVCCCAAKSMQDTAMEEGETKIIINDNSELVRRFSGWEPKVRKIVGHAAKVCCRVFES